MPNKQKQTSHKNTQKKTLKTNAANLFNKICRINQDTFITTATGLQPNCSK